MHDDHSSPLSVSALRLGVPSLAAALLIALASASPAGATGESETSAFCAEDTNHDQYIDVGDIGLVTNVFGQTGPATLDIAPPLAPNGFIDTADIGAVTAHFGTKCYGTTGTEMGGDSLTSSVWGCTFQTAGFILGPVTGGSFTNDWGGKTRCLSDGGGLTSFCRFQFEYRDSGGTWHTIAISEDMTMAGTYCIAQGYPAVLPHYTVMRGTIWHWISQPGNFAHPPMFHAETYHFTIP